MNVKIFNKMFLHVKFCLPIFVMDLTRAMFLEQEVLDSLLYNSTYDKRIPPGRDRTEASLGEPTTVTVRLLISDIFEVDEEHMDFSLTVYFRQSWVDQRLKFDDDYMVLQLSHHDMKNVWTPDTYINELKDGYRHDIVKSNVLMHINSNGTVLYSMRLTTKISCLMHFHLYPLDKHICTIEIGSYGHNADYIVYEWQKKAPVSVTSISLPLYSVPNKISNVTKMLYFDGFAGGYSTLEATIEFRRSIGYYLIELFVPDILIIVLSWVSFWLHPDAVPARVSLGCVTVLTISSQSSASRGHAPRVSYVKAADIWTLFQILFVFAAMVEYSIVNVLARTKRPQTKVNMKDLNLADICNRNTDITNMDNGNLEIKRSRDNRPYCQRAKRIDLICRSAFPIAYLIFNAIFWTVLSNVE